VTPRPGIVVDVTALPIKPKAYDLRRNRHEGTRPVTDESLDRHSGNAPRNLGDKLKHPEGSPLWGLECTFTRSEYYDRSTA
jgi:hypothetical protein